VVTDAPPTTVIALATYHRPLLLARVLPLLVAQAAGVGPSVSILVVDNDAERSAEATVRQWLSHNVSYECESRPGIAAARNRAIDKAANADLMVFIDDDEVPGEGWLRLLLDHWARWRCAAIAGPVGAELVTQPREWVTASGHFEARRLATGTILPGAPTSNLLVDLHILRELGLRFEDAFGLTGGSDTMLTGRLVAGGGVIRWCAEATVTEIVPAERATRQWVIERNRRASNVWSRVMLALAASPADRRRVRWGLTLRSGYLLFLGSTKSLVGRLRGDLHGRARGQIITTMARGLLSGAYGRIVTEYRRES
jgi:succinoglycan biosynthesis protein ExoM